MNGPTINAGISRSRVQAIMWSMSVIGALAVCFALMLQVKGVKSDIAATERQILQTKQELMVLETEFQTRARQQQLVRWNEVEFGYVAPKANQFFETRQELATLGKPVELAAPAPMRMADADDTTQTGPAVRVAAADAAPAPIGRMRQLVARDVASAPAGEERATRTVPVFQSVSVEPARLPAIAAVRTAEKPRRERSGGNARNFAERFDLDTILAKAEGAN